MFEKVNPSHPDKVADRIAGAIVDLCYTKSRNPKVACEVLIGHGGFASGIGRFKESDVKIINLKDKFFDNNGRIQTFKSNAYGYSVNGKVLTKNGQILNAGSKFGAEVFKSTTLTEKGLGSAAPYKGVVDTMHFY